MNGLTPNGFKKISHFIESMSLIIDKLTLVDSIEGTNEMAYLVFISAILQLETPKTQAFLGSTIPIQEYKKKMKCMRKCMIK